MKLARAQSITPATLLPGEHLLYAIRRSRSLASILQSLLIDTFILLAVTLLTRLCSRILVESYLRPGRLLDPANLISLNLLLGVIPLVALFALIYQFITSFSLELILTDRRIFGRVIGVWGPRWVEFRLHEVESLYEWMGYLYLESGGRRLVTGGFDDMHAFIQMFRSTAPTVRVRRPVATHSSIP